MPDKLGIGHRVVILRRRSGLIAGSRRSLLFPTSPHSLVPPLINSARGKTTWNAPSAKVESVIEEKPEAK